MNTWVKVCGITREEDARIALDAGANAIGIILTESPRRVNPEQAFRIRNSLPSTVECVGVFTNESMEEILDLSEALRLDRIQLHGSPEEARIQSLQGYRPVIQAVRVLPDGSFNRDLLNSEADHLLLDTAIKGQSGGTGKVFKWATLNAIDMSRLIVAGGVGPENVTELITRYRPYGVDASSQLELSPGIKDPAKVRAYLAAARAADQSLTRKFDEN